MTKRFKFRYVNEVVGGFVLCTVALLVVGILVAGNAQHWFETIYEITLKFPPEGSMELQAGADVMLLGTKVGAVKDIQVEDDGRMTGIITVRGQFMRFVRKDSVAQVKRKLVVTGDAYVELTRGQGAELPRTGGELVTIQYSEILDVLTMMMDEFRVDFAKTLELVQAAIKEYTLVAQNLNNPDGQLQRILANADGLLTDIRQGDGLPAKLLNDPAMATNIEATVEQVNALLVSLNDVVKEIQTTVEKLPPMVDTLSDETDNLPVVIGDAQTLMRESTATLEGLQRHWLLRKYMESGDAIRAGEVLP